MTPSVFNVNRSKDQLVVERFTPGRGKLVIQGSTCIGICLFFIFGYLVGQLKAAALLTIGSLLFPALFYVGLSLMVSEWRTKENLELNRKTELLIYTKYGKHPWLIPNAKSVIASSPPFLLEYLRFPLDKITSVHAMTVDTVDGFEEYLVLYFGEIDTYLAIWEQSFSKFGYKIPEEISKFLGQPGGAEINKPPAISFSLPVVNNMLQQISTRGEGLRVNPGKTFLSYDHKLAISAALLTLEENHRAIQQKPNDAHAHLILGLAHLGHNWKVSAIQHLQIAHRLFINDGDKCHARRTQGYLSALKVST